MQQGIWSFLQAPVVKGTEVLSRLAGRWEPEVGAKVAVCRVFFCCKRTPGMQTPAMSAWGWGCTLGQQPWGRPCQPVQGSHQQGAGRSPYLPLQEFPQNKTFTPQTSNQKQSCRAAGKGGRNHSVIIYPQLTELSSWLFKWLHRAEHTHWKLSFKWAIEANRGVTEHTENAFSLHIWGIWTNWTWMHLP